MSFEKQNHHYVPQYWLRGFRGTGGRLYGLFGQNIKVVSTKSVMKRDFLYTIFDDQWNPSDALEDALSVTEAEYAKLFQRLHTPGYSTTTRDRDQLCEALALQASRHPDVLGRVHRLGKELGNLLANVHSMALDSFKREIANFGINESDAHDAYIALTMHSKEKLACELDELITLSPQSQQLPEQIALLAAPQITDAIKKLEISLLVANPSEAFVLGDTPIPQSDLSGGFSVPLSKSLAAQAIPTKTTQATIPRRAASADEVESTNRIQSENAAEVVVGPSAELLAKL